MVSTRIDYIRFCSCGKKLTRTVCGNVIDWRHGNMPTSICKGAK